MGQLFSDWLYEEMVIKDKNSPCHKCFVRPTCQCMHEQFYDLNIVLAFIDPDKATYEDFIKKWVDDLTGDIDDHLWCEMFYDYITTLINNGDLKYVFDRFKYFEDVYDEDGGWMPNKI